MRRTAAARHRRPDLRAARAFMAAHGCASDAQGCRRRRRPGMRPVEDPADLEAFKAALRAEASQRRRARGALSAARAHVESRSSGQRGGITHLFERECTLQRRSRSSWKSPRARISIRSCASRSSTRPSPSPVRSTEASAPSNSSSTRTARRRRDLRLHGGQSTPAGGAHRHRNGHGCGPRADPVRDRFRCQLSTWDSTHPRPPRPRHPGAREHRADAARRHGPAGRHADALCAAFRARCANGRTVHGLHLVARVRFAARQSSRTSLPGLHARCARPRAPWRNSNSWAFPNRDFCAPCSAMPTSSQTARTALSRQTLCLARQRAKAITGRTASAPAAANPTAGARVDTTTRSPSLSEREQPGETPKRRQRALSPCPHPCRATVLAYDVTVGERFAQAAAPVMEAMKMEHVIAPAAAGCRTWLPPGEAVPKARSCSGSNRRRRGAGEETPPKSISRRAGRISTSTRTARARPGRGTTRREARRKTTAHRAKRTWTTRRPDNYIEYGPLVIAAASPPSCRRAHPAYASRRHDRGHRFRERRAVRGRAPSARS